MCSCRDEYFGDGITCLFNGQSKLQYYFRIAHLLGIEIPINFAISVLNQH